MSKSIIFQIKKQIEERQSEKNQQFRYTKECLNFFQQILDNYKVRGFSTELINPKEDWEYDFDMRMINGNTSIRIYKPKGKNPLYEEKVGDKLDLIQFTKNEDWNILVKTLSKFPIINSLQKIKIIRY